MFSLTEQKKELILLQSYFLYIVSDGPKEKNSLCYNIIFCMFSIMEQEKKWFLKNSSSSNIIFSILSMMEQEKKMIFKKLIQLSHYVLYIVKWWSKRKISCCYNIIFCMLSMMEQEKKLILLSLYFLWVVCDGAIEKTSSVITLFFVSCLWWSKRKKLILL